MSTRQKVVIWAAVFAISATGLYPPWVHIARWQERRYSYGWLFTPPAVPNPEWRTELDTTWLIIEWVVAGALMAALFFSPLGLRVDTHCQPASCGLA